LLPISFIARQALKVGDRHPRTTLAVMSEIGLQNIDSAPLLRGKRVVLRGLPGTYSEQKPQERARSESRRES